jgi:hypothetical protein
MRKKIRAVMVLAALPAVVAIILMAFSGTARAGEVVTTQELIDNMGKYDGQEVTIVGEAIGDLMQRGDFGWITVNDDPYSVKSIEEGGSHQGVSNVGIGVWAPMSEIGDIHILGGYKNKGDLVRVTGIFNRVCNEHGGDTDIHAKSVVVIERGHAFSHPFKYWLLVLVLILGGIIAILWNIRRLRIRKALRKA